MGEGIKGIHWIYASMWFATAVAVGIAVAFTGEAECLWAFLAPMIATVHMSEGQ